MQPATVSADAVVSSVILHSVKMKPDGQNTELLQTAKARVEGPSGRKIARCLLDGGSQRSFLHENLVKVLKLVTYSSHIFLLCSSNVPTQHSESHIREWDKQQIIEIEAIETPQVCTAVMIQIQHELNRKGLQLSYFPGDDNDLNSLP